ncbi:MAG: protoporphyrinogen oxidase [Acidobacteriaceae bacterium]|nr:protoporphyrinogen oxidase [Acidobacteriaceae bacterium]
MKHIAIIGGGISGLTAAYELEQARRRGVELDWHLYEASNRFGGIVETSHHQGFVLEGGPDGWVSEKPAARELAIELGLEQELIFSNDATRKTYILRDHQLEEIPASMRMMVPMDLAALETSPLFSREAKRAYAAEAGRARELKDTAPREDESVASFVARHFGQEVLDTLAAPLLSGVFGGDVHRLSVRAVMPQFVAMEREHGSLIIGLQQRRAALERTGSTSAQPIFTSLRRGMGSLVQALVEALPADRLHLGIRLNALPADTDATLLATSLDTTCRLLPAAAPLLPAEASSALLIAFVWPGALAQDFSVPPGFGYLVPPTGSAEHLLACTFVDQKFPHRTPEQGGRILRAFYGGAAAARLRNATDETIAHDALEQLRHTLGPLPEPTHTTVRRWPRSLPQYEVGHLNRMAQLDQLVATLPGLHLLGNSYRGVGLPDLIHAARATARRLAQEPS